MNESEAEISWTISPNPVENSCMISGSKKDREISILSFDRKLVMAIGLETKIDLSELHSGVYLVKIGGQQMRIIKQ